MIGYISIKQIMDDILVHPLLRDLTLERAVNYAQEFIRIVGCPKLFDEKVAKVHIKDYRAVLPCDCIEVISVRGARGEEYRYTTDTFHLAHDRHLPYDKTYKIQGNVIYTVDKECDIDISYQSILVDEDGFPLIPDNSSFIKALELYIKKLWFTILLDLGKITLASFANVMLDYAWYVGLALSDLVKPSIDEMEAFTNMWNLLVVKNNEHKKQFVNTGSREYIKLQ